MAAISDQVVVEVVAKTDRARADIIRYAKSFDDADVSVRRATDGMGRSVFNFANTVRTALAGALVAQIIRVNKEFASLKTSLDTATGSAANANIAFDALKQFAATTPYQLQEVVGGFIKLKNMGLDPSIAALTSYGNTAGALGKTLNEMIEAVADAATGEFERLKEFGIRASKQGDDVKFTFQGVTTTVKFNAAEIERYLQNLGNVNFAGGMEKQAKTLGGALSNLQDSVALLTAEFGEGGFNDALVRATTSMSSSTSGAEAFARQLGAVAGAAVDAARGLAEMIGNGGSWLTNFADRRVVAANILPNDQVQAARSRLLRTDGAFLDSEIAATQRRLAVARASAAPRGNFVNKRPGGLLARPDNFVEQDVAAKTPEMVRAEKTLAALLSLKARRTASPAVAKATEDALAQFQTAGAGATTGTPRKGRTANPAKPEESDLSKRLGGYENSDGVAIIAPEFVPPSDAEVEAAVAKVADILGKVPPIEPIDLAAFDRATELSQAFTQDLSRGLADALVYGDDLGDVLENTFKRAAAALIESKILQFLDPQGTGGGGSSGGVFGSLQRLASSVLTRKPARASGGHVSAGQVYRVNESGIEGFQPAGSGKIIPLGQMNAARPQGGVTTVVQPLHFDMRGAITTPELIADINGKIAQSSQAAMVGGASLAATKAAKARRRQL